ncbi:transposable element Tcb1 transposase [Trichonephila clavipes]|nr:transposable element Tcb1 transposase [Trichonephila clavipes]
MLYSDANGVEHTHSGPHNRDNKSSGQMNRRSPYSEPPDAFMCGERSKKLFFLNASCRLLSMEVGPLWYGGAISWRDLGPLVTLHVKVKVAHYVNILGDQVHPFVQTSFPGECPLYQDDNAPIHTAKIVHEWFAEHEGEVGHLDWPPQSPDLNIIEHLWGYLESKLCARFPPPSTISALETALHEEWLHIPLQVVHYLYASILRRIQSVSLFCHPSVHLPAYMYTPSWRIILHDLIHLAPYRVYFCLCVSSRGDSRGGKTGPMSECIKLPCRKSHLGNRTAQAKAVLVVITYHTGIGIRE